MYMYACTYVCVRVMQEYVHVCMCIHVCVYVAICTNITWMCDVRIHVSMCMCMCMHARMYTFVYVYVHVCGMSICTHVLCVRVHVCMHKLWYGKLPSSDSLAVSLRMLSSSVRYRYIFSAAYKTMSENQSIFTLGLE